MEEFLRKYGPKMAIFLIVISLALIMYVLEDVANKNSSETLKIWNNGFCPKCNTEWQLKDAYYQTYVGTRYIFECDNNHYVQLNKLPK